MGRKKCEIVRRYFKLYAGEKRLECVIRNCGSIISDHSTNLQKHLEVFHPNEFTTVMLEKERYKTRDSLNNFKDTGMRSYKKVKLDIVDACVRLVTVHSRPLSLIDDDAFRDIIQMTKFQKEKVNSHKVRDALIEQAIEVRRKISEEMKGKLICLKVDAATCVGRSFLGINTQFMKDGKLHVRTLGVVELSRSHTAEYLKSIIMQTCNAYGIGTNQIYTVTVDNAANMLKTIKILSEEDDDNGNNDDENIENINITGSEIADVLINSQQCNNNSNGTIDNEFLTTPHFTAKPIRCAAHTLQLAVADLLKKQEVSAIIEKARKVVRKLRTPLLKSILLAAHTKCAILDCITRWHSTFDMLERLLELREYCETIDAEDVKLSQLEWTKSIEILNVLKPARIATKRLQIEELLVGDSYEIFQRCIIEVKKENTNFANEFVQNIQNRLSTLFDSEVLSAAIYMDPRYNVILTDKQIEEAKSCLINTYARIERISTEIGETSNQDNSNITEDTSNMSEEDEFEIFLRNTGTIRGRNKLQNRVLHSTIENKLDEFLKEPRLKSSSDILYYWNSKKTTELYKLAEVVLAIPPTQVTVERLFSALKFILSPQRSRMAGNLINDMLLIRLNYNKN